MEVIKHGANMARTAVCETCGAMIRFQPGEILVEEHTLYNVPPEYRDYNGGDYRPCGVRYYQYIVCPECKMKIEIKDL